VEKPIIDKEEQQQQKDFCGFDKETRKKKFWSGRRRQGEI
jgi:hypothetical protein